MSSAEWGRGGGGRYAIVNIKSSLLLLLTIGITTPAFAYTECQSNVDRLFIGNGGMVWIAFTSGKVGFQSSVTADHDALISTATTAKVMGRPVIARYAADGVNCGGPYEARSDLIGLWFL